MKKQGKATFILDSRISNIVILQTTISNNNQKDDVLCIVILLFIYPCFFYDLKKAMNKIDIDRLRYRNRKSHARITIAGTRNTVCDLLWRHQ